MMTDIMNEYGVSFVCVAVISFLLCGAGIGLMQTQQSPYLLADVREYPRFVLNRIYWRGRWTPFCWIRKYY